MSFLTNLFRARRSESVVLIDISAASVAGACVRYAADQLPTVEYTCRLPIELQQDEPHAQAMLRTLEALGTTLMSEGVPALVRTAGDTAIDAALVSIDFPWQETRVHIENIVQDTEFTFTKALVNEAIQKANASTPDKMFTGASVIGTMLNGYEVHAPYGKRVHQASIIVLISLIEQAVADDIISTLKSACHIKQLTLVSGSSLRYQALRIAFPHERNALIVDATGPVEIALVRRGMLVAVSEIPQKDAAGAGARTEEYTEALRDLAKGYPLPRTIFLLARDAEFARAQQELAKVDFSSLWLSDNPPTIIPLTGAHLTGLIRQATTVVPDVPLLLMALQYQQGSHNA